jgi:SAM-dependent methyltransferase
MKKIVLTMLAVMVQLSYLNAAGLNGEIKGLIGIEATKEAIEREQPQRTVFVIGVSPGEPNFHERFDHLLNDTNTFTVFSDIEPNYEILSPGHFLQGNFARIDTLRELHQTLGGTFDVVITDGPGTTKFLDYDSEAMEELYGALKPGGTLYFHDGVAMHIGRSNTKTAINLSEQDAADLDEVLSTKFPESFKKIEGAIYFPPSIISAISVDENEVDKITAQVMKMITDYTPEKFIQTLNTLKNLGLQEAGLTQGRSFKITDEQSVRGRIVYTLQCNNFFEQHTSHIVEIVKQIQKSRLKKIFPNVDVVSQDLDEESLRIVRPRDQNNLGFIIYKIRKQS